MKTMTKLNLSIIYHTLEKYLYIIIYILNMILKNISL